MDDANANPVVIVLMFIARCVVPLFIMLGISYLLRRLGFIKEPPPPPEGGGNGNNNSRVGGQKNGNNKSL